MNNEETRLLSMLVDKMTNSMKQILSLNDTIKDINDRLKVLEESRKLSDRKILCTKDRHGSDIYYEVNSIGSKYRVSKKYALESNLEIIYENEKTVCEEKEKNL